MTHHRRLLGTIAALALPALSLPALPALADPAGPAAPVPLTPGFETLQSLAETPGPMEIDGQGPGFYVPSTPRTVQWGHLPNRDSAPVLSVRQPQ